MFGAIAGCGNNKNINLAQPEAVPKKQPKFVAIASGGEIAHSEDGINWKVGASLSSKFRWTDITYGKGKFIAVTARDSAGEENYNLKSAYATSVDGIEWEITTLPDGTGWGRICYGNGKFVAIELWAGKAVSSTDGVNWKKAAISIPAGWLLSGYGNGKFMALSAPNLYVGVMPLYSTDGIEWKEGEMIPIQNWYSACSGKGKFIVVGCCGGDGGSGGEVAYSADGIKWYFTKMPSKELYDTSYGNGKFVAVANNSRNAAYSADGITWRATKMPVSANWTKICYGNGKFVAVVNGGFDEYSRMKGSDKAVYSTNGIKWNETTMPCKAGWKRVCYAGD